MLTEEKITIEIAVVGPDIRWREEPNNAATMGVIIAVYNPYSGGKPAIVAKATPCGKTITAPVKPATASSLRVSFVINLNHCRNGNSDVNVIDSNLPDFKCVELSAYSRKYKCFSIQ